MSTRLFALLLAAVACAGEPPEAHHQGATDDLAPAVRQLVFRVEADRTAPGDAITLQVEGARPGQRVYLARAETQGRSCPPALRGRCTDGRRPRVVAVVDADAAGSAERTVTLPATLPVGFEFHLFAVTLTPAPVMLSGAARITVDPPLTCGDGVVQEGEDCDDAQLTPGDGCDETCHTEDGFDCTGEPSVCVTTCGDGIPAGGERCDDGTLAAGDGCDEACDPEPGWICTGRPSVCTTVCGDGVLTFDEDCDDGSAAGGDGCADCVVEVGFDCTGEPSVCTSICGDGLVRAGEACDDPAPAEDGDGCSEACLVEPGFVCTGEPSFCEIQ